MKNPYCTLLLLFICGFIQGQTPNGKSVTRSHGGQAPFIKDWFLSTGDWEKDPQLYVYEFGTGRDTVIMLHGGWGGEHSGLVDAVRDLKERYHFIFYDQRGSLRSPFPDSLVTFANHINDLELLRKEMKLEKMTIVGHSMGSVLASAYAARYPHRIRQLILLAPARLKFPIPQEDDRLLQQVAKAKNDFINRQETNEELQRYHLNRQSPALSSREETMKYRINMSKLMLYDVSKWTFMNDGRAMFKAHFIPPGGIHLPQRRLELYSRI
jgi:pimeloyl-ACP methyl ester carboxylesterase